MSKEDGAANVVDVAQAASDEVNELGRQLNQRAEDVRQEVVNQLHSAAQFIRKEARGRKIDPAIKANADRLAKGLEKGANYLNSRDVEQLGQEVTRVVRRNPIRTLAVVFIIGLVIGLRLRGDD